MEKLALRVFEVAYYWQDGCGTMHLESICLIAEDEDHALEVAAQSVDMPYGAGGVKYLGAA